MRGSALAYYLVVPYYLLHNYAANIVDCISHDVFLFWGKRLLRYKINQFIVAANSLCGIHLQVGVNTQSSF